MANGQTVTRDIGYALIKCGEFETVDEIVFANAGELQLLGSHTLDGFNAVVDAKHKRLVAAGPMPAASMAGRCSFVQPRMLLRPGLLANALP